MTSTVASGWYGCVFPGVIWLAALGFLVVAYGFSPASGALPVLIGWTTLVLTGIDLFFRMQTPAARTVARALGVDAQVRAPETGQPVLSSRVVTAVAAVAGLAAGMVLAGILCAVPIFLFVALRWGGGRTRVTSLAVAVAVTALLWGVFAKLLRLEVYSGLLFGGDW